MCAPTNPAAPTTFPRRSNLNATLNTGLLYWCLMSAVMNSAHAQFNPAYQRFFRLLLLAVLARSCSACSNVSSNYTSCTNCQSCVAQQLWWCDVNDVTSNDGKISYCAPPSIGCQCVNQGLVGPDGSKDYNYCEPRFTNSTYLFTFRTPTDCNTGVGFCAPHLPNSACIGIIYGSCHLFSTLCALIYNRIEWSPQRRRFVADPVNAFDTHYITSHALHYIALHCGALYYIAYCITLHTQRNASPL